MKQFLRQILSPLLALCLFSAALWIVHRNLANIHYQDIVRYLQDTSWYKLLAAIGLTVVSYLIMTAYDQLAVHYIDHPLKRGRVMLASFISYAFSNSIGLSLITSGSVRYRLYSAWGFSAEEITKLVAFVFITFWLGILTLGGLVFMVEPSTVLPLPGLKYFPSRAVGIFLLALAAGYLLLVKFHRSSFSLGSWEFVFPKPTTGLLQIVTGTLDWIMAGTVLFVLLPQQIHLSFFGFLEIFLLAQIAGLISNIPGGLGVFESIILVLTPEIPPSSLVGSLFLYRGAYYLLPLIVATLLLSWTEIMQKQAAVGRMVHLIGQWGSIIIPQFLSLCALIAGSILLFSGAIPAMPQRIQWLQEFLPLSVLQFSHFLGSLTGAILLLLARGLQQRLDAAYLLTAAFLAAGSLFSFLKGGDYEETILLLLMLAALLPCRRYFYRKSSLFVESFSYGWVVAILLIFITSTWLGIFIYKHVAYSNDLWWNFALKEDAPRFMRATVGAGVLLLLFSLAKLLGPSKAAPGPPDDSALETVRKIIGVSTTTQANLALLGDKVLLFDEHQRGFIMYGVEGHSWVSMGDPVGPPETARDLAWKYREMVLRHGGRPVFYEVGTAMLPIYLDMGLTLFKLGEEAKVPLAEFSLKGSKRSNLRHILNRLGKEGCEFELCPVEGIPEILPDLHRVSDNWLQEKNTREKGFSLGYFDENYLLNFPAAIIRIEQEIIAFANLWTDGDKQELSVDLMRYNTRAPNGIMDYLFVKLMLWGQEQGYQYFNLGMSPLSGLDNRSFAPLWNKIGAFIFREGEHFYNFEGLRTYKNKFSPVWEPRYLACPGGLTLPRVLINITTLISGGIKGVISK